MLRNSRRWLAGLLLLLLPWQGTAMATRCPLMQAAVGEHAIQTTSAGVHAAQATATEAAAHCRGHVGSNRQPSGNQQQPHNQTSGCTTMAACALCAAITSASRAPAVFAAHAKPVITLAANYASYIPDGLLRPPRVLA